MPNDKRSVIFILLVLFVRLFIEITQRIASYPPASYDNRTASISMSVACIFLANDGNACIWKARACEQNPFTGLAIFKTTQDSFKRA